MLIFCHENKITYILKTGETERKNLIRTSFIQYKFSEKT